MKPVVHYPRDGITYSKGACGSHSVSSILDWNKVTCPKCKELKEKLDTGLPLIYTYPNTARAIGVSIMFNIVNKQTGQVVSKNIKSRSSAIKVRDRKDNAYGAYVHMIVRVEEQ